MEKRCTFGYLLAERRLAYRKHSHRKYFKCCSRKKDIGIENARLTVSKVWTENKHKVESPGYTLSNGYVTLNYFNYDERHNELTITDDTNNSAGKQIEVKEFGKDVRNSKDDRPSNNKTNSLHTIGSNDSEVKRGTFCEEKHTKSNTVTRPKKAGSNFHHKQENQENDQKGDNLLKKRELPSIPTSNEAELASKIDHIRNAQRFLRKQIRELQYDIEAKMAESNVQSEEMAEINNEIVQFKVAVIQEAQDFERFLQQNTEEKTTTMFNPIYDTCTQLSRIKTVTIINDCLQDLHNFTDGLDKDLANSINILKGELLALQYNLADLTEQREKIIRQKILLLDSKDDNLCVNISSESTVDHSFERIAYIPDTNRSEELENISVLSHKCGPITEPVPNKQHFHNLLTCFHGESDENTHNKTDSKALSEQQKKWKKLDRQYRKHSDKLRKLSELSSKQSVKYTHSVEKGEEEYTDRDLGKRFSLRFNFDIPWREKSKQMKTTCKHLKQGFKESARMGCNNLRKLGKDLTKHYVCKPTKGYATALKTDVRERFEQLRAWLKDTCKALSMKCKPVKLSFNKRGKRINEYFNSLSKRYTELKRNFTRQKKSNFPQAKESRTQTIRRHIRVFLYRAKLVLKFRNVLMFDREIILPKKRYRLFEWYDLPIAVVYGTDRFHQIENRFQRQLNITNQDECRYDIRVYGPMEYQLGRALTFNELALIQEEKIAILRDAVYKKNRNRKRKSRTHLALVELRHNMCVSCLRCVKDCVFSCKKEIDSETGSNDSEENVNELEKSIDVRPDIVEEFIRRSTYYDPSSANLRRESTTFGIVKDRLADDLDGYTPYRRTSLLNDRELRNRAASIFRPTNASVRFNV